MEKIVIIICIIVIALLGYKVQSLRNEVSKLEYEAFMNRSRIISLEQSLQNVGKPEVQVITVTSINFNMGETGQYILNKYGKKF